eukprot:7315236-Prymnesium_polylepis.3
MPLDSHLFADLKKAIQRHVMLTAERGDDSRFEMGTPEALSDALRRTWTTHPEPYRIKEDIERIPHTIEKIIEYRGGMVPDSVLRTGRRKERGKRPFVPHPEAQNALEEVRPELSSEAKRLCG